MNTENTPSVTDESGPSNGGSVQPAGSAPTWRQCEEKFWQVNKCLNAGDIPRFRKELGEYNLMLDDFNKATEAIAAKAPNAGDERPPT